MPSSSLAILKMCQNTELCPLLVAAVGIPAMNQKLFTQSAGEGHQLVSSVLPFIQVTADTGYPDLCPFMHLLKGGPLFGLRTVCI